MRRTAGLAAAARDLIAKAATNERERALQIVREEWHRAVEEFGLRPGTPTEAVTARILGRIAVTQDKRHD